MFFRREFHLSFNKNINWNGNRNYLKLQKIHVCVCVWVCVRKAKSGPSVLFAYQSRVRERQ